MRHYLSFSINNIYRNIVYPCIKSCIHERIDVQRKFKKITGYTLRWDNPLTFNEKIRWLNRKIHNQQIYANCTDKVLVRDYITAKIGHEYLIPLLIDTSNVDDICYENLPDYPVVIKLSHGSGHVIIVRDKNKVEWDKIRFKLSKLLKKNFYYHCRERQYKKLKPRIVVENMLLSDGKVPSDYKFSVFHGEVEFIEVISNRFEQCTNNIYDKNWVELDCLIEMPRGQSAAKPKNLSAMIDIARRLGQDFPFVRVDLYTIGDRIYFGELTFTPSGGMQEFVPRSYDLYFGSKIDLDRVGDI